MDSRAALGRRALPIDVAVCLDLLLRARDLGVEIGQVTTCPHLGRVGTGALALISVWSSDHGPNHDRRGASVMDLALGPTVDARTHYFRHIKQSRAISGMTVHSFESLRPHVYAACPGESGLETCASAAVDAAWRSALDVRNTIGQRHVLGKRPAIRAIGRSRLTRRP
jgi:hypothetical protein